MGRPVAESASTPGFVRAVVIPLHLPSLALPAHSLTPSTVPSSPFWSSEAGPQLPTAQKEGLPPPESPTPCPARPLPEEAQGALRAPPAAYMATPSSHTVP